MQFTVQVPRSGLYTPLLTTNVIHWVSPLALSITTLPCWTPDGMVWPCTSGRFSPMSIAISIMVEGRVSSGRLTNWHNIIRAGWNAGIAHAEKARDTQRVTATNWSCRRERGRARPPLKNYVNLRLPMLSFLYISPNPAAADGGDFVQSLK